MAMKGALTLDEPLFHSFIKGLTPVIQRLSLSDRMQSVAD